MAAGQNDRWRTEVDQQLGVLTTEVSGIKAQLRDQSETLSKIFTRLDEISGKQGPGIKHILTVVVSSVTILVAASGAITVLVNSFVSPQLTRLEAQGAHNNTVVSYLLSERIDEFKRLKDEDRERQNERFRRLEDQISRLSAAQPQNWTPSIKQN